MSLATRKTAALFAVACAVGGFTARRAAAQSPAPPASGGGHALNVAFKDLKWQKIVPELGKRSPEIVILRVDPGTQATQLMIRVPKNTHVPKHWHTANETHTIMSGTFIIECEGKRAELGANSFNFVPSKMEHEAWTRPDSGALLFITVDGAWDINWVGGPPRPEDFTPRATRQAP